MKKLILIALLIHSAAFGQSSKGQLIFTDASFQYQNTNDFSSKGTKHAMCGTGYDNVTYAAYGWVTVFDDNQAVWSKKIPLSDFYANNASIKLMNNSEDVVLCLEGTNSSTNRYGYALTRLNYATGDVVWSKHVQFADSMLGNYTFLDAVKVNAQDEIIVTNSLFDCLYAAKFSATGDLIFSKKINNINDGIGKNPGFSFTETSDGGYIGTLKNESNPTLVKLNSDLSVAWSKIWSIEGYSHPRTTLELSNGKFAIAGLGDLGCFIAIMDQNGVIESYKTIQSQAGSYYGLDYLSEMSENKFFAVGFGFCMTIDMTTGLVTEYNNAYGSQLNFNLSGGVNLYEGFANPNAPNTASFSTLFNPEESSCNPFQTTSYYSADVTLSPNQVMNTTFYVVNTGDLSNYTLTAQPLSVSLVSGCFLSVDETTSLSFELFPNPVSTDNQLTIQLRNNALSGESIQLTDLSGAVIQQVKVESSTIEMTIPKVAAGMYMVNYLDQNKNIIASKKLAVN
ncbi:MAG: T9SS type A sorting domain-containing protein [Fluviicola sp.]|nr:T9SS type A sorting domain-containing protein [Fluviicola sp.]